MEADALARLRVRLSSDLFVTEQEMEPAATGISGIGVANVAERMRIMFGDAFSIDYQQRTR